MSSAEPSDHSFLNGFRNLSQLRETHCRDRGAQDALCVFLGIHQCIAEAVSLSGSAPIKRLNSNFANLCIQVYYYFEERSGRLFGELWSHALAGYIDAPRDLPERLPSMAAAHIIEDLPNAIYDSRPVAKSEYDAVFDHIVQCVDLARRSNRISSTAWRNVLRQFKRKSPEQTTVVRALLTIGVAVAWLPLVLNPGIRTMREVAWRIAENKMKISDTPRNQYS